MKTYYIKIKLSSSLNIEDTFNKIEEGLLIGTELIEVPDTLEVEKIECAEAAAEACPVQCIHVEK